MGNGNRTGRKHQRDLAANDVDDRRPAAFVRHVQKLDARHLVEHLAGEMREIADARRRVRDLARSSPREIDELRYRARGKRRRGNHDQAAGGEKTGDWREVGQCVVRQLAVDVRIAGVAAGSHQQRVTIRRRARHRLAREHAIRAGAIVGHDLLAENYAQPRGQNARDRVRSAARRRRHEQPDRALRICAAG